MKLKDPVPVLKPDHVLVELQVKPCDEVAVSFSPPVKLDVELSGQCRDVVGDRVLHEVLTLTKSVLSSDVVGNSVISDVVEFA